MLGRVFVFGVTVLAFVVFWNYVIRTVAYQHEESPAAQGILYDLGL